MTKVATLLTHTVKKKWKQTIRRVIVLMKEVNIVAEKSI